MSAYIFLLAAIAFEILGTMLLPHTKNFAHINLTILVLTSYSLSVFFLANVSQMLPLAIVYSSWAGLGVFSVAILSYYIYGQPLNWQIIVGLFLIVIGVTIVNVFKS
mgnify:CR=1 FL=1